jgi:O-antigen/teichoic acid export membrane protein
MRELSLKRRIIRSTVWIISSEATNSLLHLVSNLILTRLLFPEAFGLMALVYVFIRGVHLFSDVGLRPCIIQNRQGDDPVFLNTAWTIQVVRGILIWIVTCAIALPLAYFYRQPQMLWLLPVVGLNSIVTGFFPTKLILCDRHLQQGRVTILQILANLFGLTCMALLAWRFASIWALVAGEMLNNLATLVMSHSGLLPGMSNRFGWNREVRQEIYHFGKWIFLSTLLAYLTSHADRLLFGKLIPLDLLGVYAIGVTIAKLTLNLIAKLNLSVTMPAYARSIDTGADIEPVYHRAHKSILILGGACLSFLIVYGPLLVQILYDSRYQKAGWIVQLLAVGQWFAVISSANGSALVAIGKPRGMAAGNLVMLVSLMALVPVSFVHFGFKGALVALIGPEILKYLTIATCSRINGLIGWGIEAGLTAAVFFCGAIALVLHHGVNLGISLPIEICCVTFIYGIIWGPLGWKAYKSVRGASPRTNMPITV